MTREQAQDRADAAIAAVEAKKGKWMRGALIIGGIIFALLILLR
jgi:hypothetical protein